MRLLLLLLLSHLLWLLPPPPLTPPWIWWSPVHQRLRSLHSPGLLGKLLQWVQPGFPLLSGKHSTENPWPSKKLWQWIPCPVATGSFHFLSPRLDRSLSPLQLQRCTAGSQCPLETCCNTFTLEGAFYPLPGDEGIEKISAFSKKSHKSSGNTLSSHLDIKYILVIIKHLLSTTYI